MNSSSRRLFYVYHPELDDREAFRSHCGHEQTIVLGCFVEPEGIYIYDVTDQRLAGIEEVTAAHEMLHAAYSRLSTKERQRIDKLTASTFAALTDERIKQTIENYRSRDPGVVPNELHSILGTGVSELPKELETYYKRYFTDRSAVVTLSRTYEANFTDRQKQVEAYDAQSVN